MATLAIAALLALAWSRWADEPARFEARHPGPLDGSWLGTGTDLAAGSGCPGDGRRVCLVALGSEAQEAIGDLQAYFTASYELQLVVLPSIDLEGEERFNGELVDVNRAQLKGDAAVELLKRHFPDAWEDETATLIAVTPHDIYDSRTGGSYLYSVRGVRPGRFAVVSDARMDDGAWGDEPDDSLLRIRTRKLVAREIGALHYGLSFSADPTSVMVGTFGSRSGVDRTSEFLPLRELEARDPELVTGIRTWEAAGAGRTPTFRLDPGAWEYCATILGAGDPASGGLRVSLYDASGAWISSDSGSGTLAGDLGCTPMSGPGRFDLRVASSPEALQWSVVIAPSGTTPRPQAELPSWRTDYTTRLTPTLVSQNEVFFDEQDGGWSPWFSPKADSWEICWEAYEVPQALAGADHPQQTQVTATLLIEHERGDFGRWTTQGAEAGDEECFTVPNEQPHARHWIRFDETAESLAVRWTLRDVTIVD
jgi:predicted Zn-dependent protease